VLVLVVVSAGYATSATFIFPPFRAIVINVRYILVSKCGGRGGAGASITFTTTTTTTTTIQVFAVCVCTSNSADSCAGEPASAAARKPILELELHNQKERKAGFFTHQPKRTQ
jgi:hypothetical protein